MERSGWYILVFIHIKLDINHGINSRLSGCVEVWTEPGLLTFVLQVKLENKGDVPPGQYCQHSSASSASPDWALGDGMLGNKLPSSTHSNNTAVFQFMSHSFPVQQTLLEKLLGIFNYHITSLQSQAHCLHFGLCRNPTKYLLFVVVLI